MLHSSYSSSENLKWSVIVNVEKRKFLEIIQAVSKIVFYELLCSRTFLKCISVDCNVSRKIRISVKVYLLETLIFISHD